jgi:hypothetical protein
MKLFIAVLTVVLFCSNVKAQPLQLYDPVANRTFSAEKYTSIRGVPFLFDKWMNAIIYTEKGYYEGLQIKYDLFENKIYFNKNDESFELQENVKNFTLFSNPSDPKSALKFSKGFKGSGLNADQFVQVLVDGNVQLLKSDIKSLTEMSEINAGMVKTFATTTRYYINNSKGVFLIRFNKSELLPFLQDKDEQIQSFIKEKGLNLKRDMDLLTLLNYYNSL